MLSSNRAVCNLLQKTQVAVLPRFKSAVAVSPRGEPITEAQLEMFPMFGELNFLFDLFYASFINRTLLLTHSLLNQRNERGMGNTKWFGIETQNFLKNHWNLQIFNFVIMEVTISVESPIHNVHCLGQIDHVSMNLSTIYNCFHNSFCNLDN